MQGPTNIYISQKQLFHFLRRLSDAATLDTYAADRGHSRKRGKDLSIFIKHRSRRGFFLQEEPCPLQHNNA